MSTMTKERSVTVIPAKHDQLFETIGEKTKRRTAGYARVSTNDEEQLTSYEAQVDYYTKLIQSNPAWQYIEVYADESMTYGQNSKKPMNANFL